MARAGSHVLALAAALAALVGAPAQSAELKAAVALGLKGAMADIQPSFEAATGHRVRIAFEPPAVVSKRLADGESFDVLALPREPLEALATQGVVTSGSVREIARARMGVGTKPGGSRPDISTPEGLKTALLSARSIVHSDPARGGAGAINSIAMFNDLGIAAEMKAKTIYPREHSPAGVAREVLEGRAEFAMNQVHEIVESGLDLVGAFPAKLGRTVVFAAAPARSSPQADAARALVEYLRGPEAIRLLKAHGLEPPDP